MLYYFPERLCIIHTFGHENKNENKNDADIRSLTNLHKCEAEMLKQPFTERKEHIQETWVLFTLPLGRHDACFISSALSHRPLSRHYAEYF